MTRRKPYPSPSPAEIAQSERAEARAEIDRLRHEISTLRDALRGDAESGILRGVVADHLERILDADAS